MKQQRQLVSFDWAIKRLLRSKANFDILEGFLSELLKDDIKILSILESESNRDFARQKANRIDLKVANGKNHVSDPSALFKPAPRKPRTSSGTPVARQIARLPPPQNS